MGLTINDLMTFEYKDIIKIMLCFIDDTNNNTKTRKATQADWDKLATRR